MRLCLFEDGKYGNFFPLALTRPVYFLKCGITGLEEKIRSYYKDLPVVYHCRIYLEDTVKEAVSSDVNVFKPDNYLFVNGRIMFNKELAESINSSDGAVYMSGDDVAAAVIPESMSARIENSNIIKQDLRLLFPELPVKEIDAEFYRYPWDLIEHNSVKIIDDFSMLCTEPVKKNAKCDESHILNEDNLYIGKDVTIKPGVVLDAENGPVYIDDNVTLMSNAVIEGPAYIGKSCVIKVGTKIYRGTSIGEKCKIGGEVGNTIIHSYSNKQHEGFLGHSYLGQWINLGADTNNSDLKNNYKSVRVVLNGKEIDTGRTFIGFFMGDHSKTGINTMINTGTVVGVHSNIFGGGFPGKFIPSFSWGGSEKMTEHELEKALETAEIVMKRRNRELSAAERRLYCKIHEITREERANFLD